MECFDGAAEVVEEVREVGPDAALFLGLELSEAVGLDGCSVCEDGLFAFRLVPLPDAFVCGGALVLEF
ncbi:MAG: hypothetical protein EDX89_08490 [Acidobacteria bacterium]|nr:MAG: hypothetical protein EDX89_08490 [Acidobacteriota bacterium]